MHTSELQIEETVPRTGNPRNITGYHPAGARIPVVPLKSPGFT
jgi:hypothetical protein